MRLKPGRILVFTKRVVLASEDVRIKFCGYSGRVRTRLDSLTALRFIAAFGVIICHTAQAVFPKSTAVNVAITGQFGVDFFFILSGFVLTWSVNIRRSDRQFWGLRFARVWPLHFVTLLVAACLVYRTTPLLAYPVQLTLTQSWWPQQSIYWGLNGPSWTLSCEAFFYACFPLLFKWLHSQSASRLWIVVTCSWLGTLVMPVIVHFTPALWSRVEFFAVIFPPARLPQFVLGISLALILRQGFITRISPLMPGVGVLLVLLASGLMLEHSPSEEWMTSTAVTPFFGALILLMASRDSRGHWRIPAIWVRLGEWSFALYLTHLFVVHYLGARIGGVTGFAVTVIVSIVISAIAHRFIEAPAERYIRRKVLNRRDVPRLAAEQLS